MIRKINSFFNNFFVGKFFNSNKIINPKRDWIILIALFLIMIISVLSFDLITYERIANGDMYVSVSKDELNLENLKTDALKKLIENFESKSAKISSLKIEPSIDPSI